MDVTVVGKLLDTMGPQATKKDTAEGYFALCECQGQNFGENLEGRMKSWRKWYYLMEIGHFSHTQQRPQWDFLWKKEAILSMVVSFKK